MTNFDADVGLIGAGPMGIELAVALKHAGISCLHWDAGQIGATMQWWPPGTRWFSSNDRIAIAGVPLITPQQEKASREDYLAYLRQIVTMFELDIHTYEPVVGIEHGHRPEGNGLAGESSHGFLITTERRGERRTYRTRKLILATGGTSHPNRLNIKGENLPHVSHYFHDPHACFRQRVLVVGGRNSAVETALRTYRAGAHVTLSYRRPTLDAKDIKYWLYPEIDGLAKCGRIVTHFNTVVEEITPAVAWLRNTATGTITEVPADFVLLMTGYVADMSLFHAAGVHLQTLPDRTAAPVFDEATMETNIPGLYVAGTAIAGTQTRYRIFLENCHVHAERILAALQGFEVHIESQSFGRPET